MKMCYGYQVSVCVYSLSIQLEVNSEDKLGLFLP